MFEEVVQNFGKSDGDIIYQKKCLFLLDAFVQFEQKILKGLYPGHLLTNWHNGAKMIILSHSIVLPPIFQIMENIEKIFSET